MQVISKVEQPTSPSSSNSIITPKNSKDLMQTITKLLEGGQEAAQQLKILFNNKRLGFKVEDDDHDHLHVIERYCGVTLNTFETCLSMLRSYDFDHQEEIAVNKRKFDRANDVQCSEHDQSSKSEQIIDAKVSKERRGCYKRRRTGQSRTMETSSLTDDGYAWRKYGQKEILNTDYPRSYYRCTHKHDQDCQATKQVQQISKNPTKYNIIYHGQHTCRNLHKTSSIVIDNFLVDQNSLLLSFDTNNYPTSKHAPNPYLFPSSTSHNSMTTMVNHDHDHHIGPHKQYSSSSSASDNYAPSSSDLTSTGLSSTPVSCDHALDEIYSSTSTPYEMDEDVFLSLFNMEQDYNPRLDGLF